MNDDKFGYRPDWPKCPCCGRPALDGHITCGRVECDEAWHRQRRDDRASLIARDFCPECCSPTRYQDDTSRMCIGCGYIVRTS